MLRDKIRVGLASQRKGLALLLTIMILGTKVVYYKQSYNTMLQYLSISVLSQLLSQQLKKKEFSWLHQSVFTRIRFG
jgi:hypothetical protein